MKKSYEAKYHTLEENYWWFIGRRSVMLQLLADQARDSKILEIGCSGGIFMRSLGKVGFKDVTGIDISKDAIRVCKSRGIRNVMLMDGTKLAFPDNTFDMVVASDILEHIKDDKHALGEWRRVLKPSGKLLVFVPAFNALWGSHDEANLHYRRYSRPELVGRLKDAGFSILRSSYWNFSLFFPSTLIRICKRHLFRKSRKHEDDFYRLNPFANKLLAGLLRTENWFLSFLNFPVGVSVFAVAEKR